MTFMKKCLMRTIAIVVTCMFCTTAAIVAADQQGSVTVTVVDAGGEPVTDARVVLVELRRSQFVDEKGAVQFVDVPAGEYHLEARSRRLGSAVEEFTLGAGEDYAARVEIKRSVHYEHIIVTATAGGRGSAEVVVPVNVLDEERLQERMQPTLGETLAQEPGIHSTFFGVGSSRPIIRGQGGGRVRILEGGLGVGDASTSSPDHAVTTDPLSADTVEVLRGPAAS